MRLLRGLLRLAPCVVAWLAASAVCHDHDHEHDGIAKKQQLSFSSAVFPVARSDASSSDAISRTYAG